MFGFVLCNDIIISFQFILELTIVFILKELMFIVDSIEAACL
jgi:hypothetical protein